MSSSEKLDTTLDNILDVDNSELDNIGDMFSGLLTTLTTFRSQITTIQMGIKNVEKTVKKKIKTLQKEAAKGKNKGGKKASGFAKPTAISPELCLFMSRPKGTEMARTDVTQYLIKYISEKNLQNPENRKAILPDPPLKELLGVSEKDELTYFNIQKYMNKHFNNKTENTIVEES